MSDLIERLRASDTLSRGENYEPWVIPPSELRLEAAAEVEALRTALSQEREAREKAEKELAELQQVFDIRWEADQRAIKEWQEVTGRKTVWPDHVDLVHFLAMALELESANNTKAEASLAEAADRIASLEKALAPFVADAKNWADTVPNDYRPRCTEPGKDYAHPGSETAFTVGDLRRAAALSSSKQKDGGE